MRTAPPFFVLVAPVFAGLSGCGLLLGLDEFVDAPPVAPDAGQGDGAGGHAACDVDETCAATMAGTVCIEGVCACPAATDTWCPGVGCVDTTASKTSCGACGVGCVVACKESACNDPIDLSAGWRHTCAVLKDGTVWCWGRNVDGEIGDGTAVDRPVPTAVSLPGPAIRVVAGGMSVNGDPLAHTCALMANGTVQCWGANGFGQLGIGTTEGSFTPKALGLAGVEHVAAGGAHTCAITRTGDLLCWGYNQYGMVGDGTTDAASLPRSIASGVLQVSAGTYHTCAIYEDRSLYCWGLNNSGQLGDGSQANQTSPNLVSMLDAVEEVALGGYSSWARNPSGLFHWGANLGGGGTLNPTPMLLNDVIGLDIGQAHASAVTPSSVWLWGTNSSGQLGNGSTSNYESWTDIGLPDVMRTALGGIHSCALKNDRSVLCWGGNSDGQLGDSTAESRYAPTPVAWP